MKTKILFIAMLILPMISFGQDEVKANLPETKVTPPAYTGVKNVTDLLANGQVISITDYLKKEIRYPEKAPECYREGTTVVQFVVKTNGELTEFKVINSVCSKMDQEVIRGLKTTEGMWIPGFNNETPVDMPQEVALMFVMHSHRYHPKQYFKHKATLLYAKANKLFLIKNKANKALKYYNISIKYLPDETSSLYMRGLCRYELGDREGAYSDWKRINAIGEFNSDSDLENLSELKGFEEMRMILEL